MRQRARTQITNRPAARGSRADGTALAVAAHPDDIEFMMAGTLCLLREAGWRIHCFNLSTGNLGSFTRPPREVARVRRREAQAAAKVLGAVWHPPVCNDLQIFYEDRTIRRVAAVIREVRPDVILTHSPEDYMEDHMNTARIVVTAASARGTPGYRTIPSRPPAPGPVRLYHASPHGLQDGLRRPVRPDAFVDTASVLERKRAALACHESQRVYLAAVQGMADFVRTMEAFSRAVGRMSGRFTHAEGWRLHSHLGFCAPDADPLRAALGGNYSVRGRRGRISIF